MGCTTNTTKHNIQIRTRLFGAFASPLSPLLVCLEGPAALISCSNADSPPYDIDGPDDE